MSIRSTTRSIASNLHARLNDRITIEQPNNTSDNGGGVSRGWTTVAIVWAEITPTRGGVEQRIGEAGIEALHSHRITMRYRAGLTTDMRLRLGSRIFNIRSITNIEEADVVLEIQVDEGGAV